MVQVRGELRVFPRVPPRMRPIWRKGGDDCYLVHILFSIWRTRASQDLKDEAASLREERVEVAVYTPIRSNMRKFNCIHEKSLSLLQKMIKA
ncbi:hypothetical protein BGW80DRAFT_1558435 [Lactifluus volemus]|nr:hypothetical protein BGW80DRAFT_1558435 [Lactifluus volemus]